jgi:hypothetical protein
MDFHLERGLRLHTEPEHKNLYDWAINEIDADGQRVGHDQIPWRWTLDFIATSCVLSDRIAAESRLQLDGAPLPPPEITQRQVIHVRLRPGRRDGNYLRETKYSMFGTDRVINDFRLDIFSIVNPAEQESCKAWGSVSYTSEIDFRYETEDDCILFYLFVKPETFARYTAKIVHGLVDEVVFSVGDVAGIYSEWSPSISTRNVKVLASGREQKVVLPPGVQFEPPRLGHVGSFDLYINRHLEFREKGPTPDPTEEAPDITGDQIVHGSPNPAVEHPQILQLLVSLRRSARFVACLLTLIFIVTFLKH